MTNSASMGGKARAAVLSATERKEIAERAAARRWGLVEATHRGELKLGDSVIPCYVLKDGRRVLSLSGMLQSLGMSKGGAKGGGERLPSFLGGKFISPFVSEDLRARAGSPLSFYALGAGKSIGFEATIIADICEVVLAARRAKQLQPQQLHIAEQCEILIRGFARVGIVALVDEATGYQEVRDKQALQAILDKYLRKEFAAWAKKFPDEFYQQIFRLRGWQWKGMKVNRPQCVAQYTQDVVYQRLAPGICEQLERVNPIQENGHRKSKHHQWLTIDVGDPALSQHLHAVVGLMRASQDWSSFIKLLDRAFPKKGETLLLPMALD